MKSYYQFAKEIQNTEFDFGNGWAGFMRAMSLDFAQRAEVVDSRTAVARLRIAELADKMQAVMEVFETKEVFEK